LRRDNREQADNQDRGEVDDRRREKGPDADLTLARKDSRTERSSDKDQRDQGRRCAADQGVKIVPLHQDVA